MIQKIFWSKIYFSVKKFLDPNLYLTQKIFHSKFFFQPQIFSYNSSNLNQLWLGLFLFWSIKTHSLGGWAAQEVTMSLILSSICLFVPFFLFWSIKTHSSKNLAAQEVTMSLIRSSICLFVPFFSFWSMKTHSSKNFFYKMFPTFSY